jgi:FAD synthase
MTVFLADVQEPHLLHDFGESDFYGDTLHLRLCGYIRPELNFNSLGMFFFNTLDP